jgi:Cu+-exporting ATPase
MVFAFREKSRSKTIPGRYMGKRHIMVKDPVCGMDIDEKDAAGTSDYRGKTYYFCTTSCKENFDKFPSRFIIGNK